MTTRIDTWAESEFGFYVDRHWQRNRWALERRPIKLARYHADILRHVFTPNKRGRLPYDQVGWCEPAKSGKSAIAGLVAEHAALHLDGNVILASNKQRQAASIMYKSLTDSVEFNPHLPNVDPKRYEVEFRNGNQVRVIASSSRTASGARFSLAVFDELWGYVHQDAQRLWSEFKTDPTRLNSVRLAVGYAGYLESELWQEILDAGMGEPVPELAHITNADGEPACWRNGRAFTFWSHECRQPWQTEEWLTSQRKTLRSAEFRRMIKCQFVEGTGDFIDLDAWAACIDPDLKALDRWLPDPIYIGLDIATKPGGDDCALCGVYERDGKVYLAFHSIWKGGKERTKDLSLSRTVEPYIYWLKNTYKIAGVWFDPYQALKLADDLRASGIKCVEVQQTHASRGPRDTRLYDLAINKDLVLYDDPDVRNAAAYATAKELGNGLLFIKKKGRGKIDLLIALSNCASAAVDRKRYGHLGVLRYA